MPDQWQRADHTNGSTATAVWTPAPNPRKESVTVIRTPRNSHGPASVPAIERELVTAQRALRGSKVSPVTRVTTKDGFTGTRLDVTFLPGVLEQNYRRTHVVLVEDDTTLVHVLYTALTPDPDRAALELILETIRKEAQS